MWCFSACGKTAAIKQSCTCMLSPTPTVFRRRLGSPWTCFHKFLKSSSGIFFSLAVFVQDQQVSAWMSSKESCWSPTPSTSVSPSHVSSLHSLFGGQRVDWGDAKLWWLSFCVFHVVCPVRVFKLRLKMLCCNIPEVMAGHMTWPPLLSGSSLTVLQSLSALLSLLDRLCPLNLLPLCCLASKTAVNFHLGLILFLTFFFVKLQFLCCLLLKLFQKVQMSRSQNVRANESFFLTSYGVCSGISDGGKLCRCFWGNMTATDVG